VWPIARYKLFNRSLTCISKASDWDSKGSAHLVAVGSHYDPRIFVLILDDKDGFDIAMTLTSEPSLCNPVACVWSERHLHVCTIQGQIASYTAKAMLATALEVTSSVPSLYPETIFEAPRARSDGEAGDSVSFLGAACRGRAPKDPSDYLAHLTSDSAVSCMFYQGKPAVEPSEDGGSSVSASLSSVIDDDLVAVPPDAFKTVDEFGAEIHADVVLCLCQAPNHALIATGNANGAVFIWQRSKDAEALGVRCVATAALHSCAVVALSFACDSSLVVSCGADGSVFILAVDRPAHIEYEFETSRHSVRARKYQHSNTPFIVAPSISSSTGIVDPHRLWIDEKKDEETVALKVQYADAVAELTESTSSLAQRLKILLDRNGTRTELERMQRGEFAVDLQLRDKIISENSETVARIRENYKLRSYWNEMQAARVRGRCYDSMVVSARAILPFNTDNTGDVKQVTAFSIPRVNDDEVNALKKVRRLRAIEMRTQRAQAQGGYGSVHRLPGEGKVRSCWAPSIQGSSSHMGWLWGDGGAWPTAEVSTYIIQKEQEAKAAENAGNAKEKEKESKEKAKDAAGAAAAASSNPAGGVGDSPARANAGGGVEDDDDRSLNSQDTVADVDENDIFNLLYSPQCIRTDAQKRMHIIMLKEVVRLIKTKFNEHFDRFVADKESVLNAVDSKNQRIEAILEELHQKEDVFRPVIGDIEKAGSAIVVFDSEIENRPFETEAMRMARFVDTCMSRRFVTFVAVCVTYRLREEDEARRREAADDKKEALARALQDMMHGTLEVKRNVLEEASSLVRPAWMTETAEADMSESQLKEYDAFNSKLRALQEEQALYRKQLEQELKKLRAEVLEVTKAFDERLVSLCRIKVLTARAVLTHELYMSRIGHSVFRIEQSVGQLAALDQSMDKAKKERRELQARIERYCAHCEEVRTAHMAADAEYHMMERQFKTHLLAACGSMAIDSEKLRILQLSFNERSYPRDDTEDAEAQGADPEQSTGNDNRPSKRGSNSKEASRNSK
jgi:hypothetical protein